jgi:acetoin utilization deacetylase AcuC-like enzyme
VKVFHHDRFDYPLPEGHRFPLARYRMLREALEGTPGIDLAESRAATDAELALAHAPQYLDRAMSGGLSAREQAALGLPWSPQLVARARHSVGGTLQASDAALEEGIAVNLGGGTHHAFADGGRGFCMFNDVVCAVRRLRAAGAIRRALVVDLDVHQGDGTHAAFATDPDSTTMAVNGGANYPFRRVAGDIEIDLPDRCGDGVYLGHVERLLGEALERGRPDICFYLAGADPYDADRLGRLSVTKPGLGLRDRYVLKVLDDLSVPVVVTLAGGYARQIADTVAINHETVSQALSLWSQAQERNLAPGV